LRTILTASMAEELIDDHLESLEINRLREMSVEPRLFVPRDVLVHPEAGQSDGRDCQVLTDMANEIDASSVRQSDVAEKQVKFSFFCEVNGFGDRAARFH